MKLLVGLGNPGVQYVKTRHNIGFMTLGKVAEIFPTRVLRADKTVHVYGTTIENQSVLLIKPQTYMNLSGIAVREVVEQYQESSENLIVVYDDLDLEVGRLRIRKQGGPGGHKGVRSIIDYLGTQAFIRVRMGIGRPQVSAASNNTFPNNSIVEYVLEPFDHEEALVIQKVIKRAIEAIKLIMADQIDVAMNAYNRALSQTT